MDMERRALIVGGGIGGLTAAIALRRADWKVTVRERDEGLPTTGTALGMWPVALRALDAIGVGDRVRRAGRRQQTGVFLRPDGSRITTIDVERLHRRTGDHVYLLSRPGLLAILHGTAMEAGAELRTGDPMDDVTEVGDVDLVVVADGVFSRAREKVFGPAYRARFSGSTVWRGVVEDMPTDTFVEMWGRGLKFGVTPQEGGRTNWYASAAAPEGQFRPGEELAELRGMFGRWAPPVHTVLDAIKESTVLRHDVYVTPPLPSFTRGTIIFLGDAAHAMTPDLGRGACEAIIDAVTLASLLRETPSVEQALHGYDRRRRRAAQKLARIAGLAARMSYLRHAIPVRDQLLRASMAAGPPGA